MYLKSLKLTGFKSFADLTRLEFEPGVSVVVGPNGTGKSNIVDAVAWVLGSQFTKELRTERMDEVVFAGTAARNPFSKAEVTVVFDNSSRLLPLDLEEVSITRRLFRGGVSEYEINGADCRLLDIQELLSDGGMGRSQHMIVGQGRLDSILTAKGGRRRRIIEEAAGILKHQARKAKALSASSRPTKTSSASATSSGRYSAAAAPSAGRPKPPNGTARSAPSCGRCASGWGARICAACASGPESWPPNSRNWRKQKPPPKRRPSGQKPRPPASGKNPGRRSGPPSRHPGRPPAWKP